MKTTKGPLSHQINNRKGRCSYSFSCTFFIYIIGVLKAIVRCFSNELFSSLVLFFRIIKDFLEEIRNITFKMCSEWYIDFEGSSAK